MPDRSRIPRGIDKFNIYLIKTTAYLTAGHPTHAERLGISVAEVEQWSALLAEWNPLYKKYSDKRGSRTTLIKDNLLSIIQKCVEFDRKNHILNRIASSLNLTIDDLLEFNIKQGVLQKTTRSVARTGISELIFAEFRPLGGGKLAIQCYNITHRVSLPDGADSVQYQFKVGNTPPASIEVTGLTKEISSKARFIFDAGPANSAKYLYMYFRWYNTKHPLLSGPWSGLRTALIV